MKVTIAEKKEGISGLQFDRRVFNDAKSVDWSDRLYVVVEFGDVRVAIPHKEIVWIEVET